MSNGINKRQNEDNSIAMLAAQRQLYDNAKRLSIITMMFSVIIPFSLSIVLLFVSRDSLWRTMPYICSIASMCVSFVTAKYIKDDKCLAATIQQKFDTYVYSMPWDRRIFGDDKNLNAKVTQYSKKILSKEAKHSALENWYTSAVDEKPIKEGILACQRENYTWDVGLRKRFRLFSKASASILCICVFAVGVCDRESVSELIYRIAFVIPVIRWMLDAVKKLNDDIENMSRLDAVINSSKKKSMEDLQDVQKMLFDHRKSCFLIPDFFYNLFKDNDEDLAHRTAMMQ